MLRDGRKTKTLRTVSGRAVRSGKRAEQEDGSMSGSNHPQKKQKKEKKLSGKREERKPHRSTRDSATGRDKSSRPASSKDRGGSTSGRRDPKEPRAVAVGKGGRSVRGKPLKKEGLRRMNARVFASGESEEEHHDEVEEDGKLKGKAFFSQQLALGSRIRKHITFLIGSGRSKGQRAVMQKRVECLQTTMKDRLKGQPKNRDTVVSEMNDLGVTCLPELLQTVQTKLDGHFKEESAQLLLFEKDRPMHCQHERCAGKHRRAHG